MMMIYTVFLLSLLSSSFLLVVVESFSSSYYQQQQNVISTTTLDTTALFASSSSSGEEEEENSSSSGLDSMRKMLEVSWNAEIMGEIPSDPIIAAKEAYTSIVSCSERGYSSVFFVDLQLPAYDITQGENLYDEVLAVEYCIALSECFKGEKTSILVRDETLLTTVSRILNAREEASALAAAAKEEEEEEKARQNILNNNKEEEDEEGDDDDKGMNNSTSSSTSEIDAFRQSLMSNWELDEDDDTFIEPPSSSFTIEEEKKEEQQQSKRYRLASMFGNNKISKGADMIQDVVSALRENALLEDDEDNLIILSSMGLGETVAVRSLVTKYESSKKIILINCKLDPLPPELNNAQTVYSLLPLIGKQQKKSSGPFANDDTEEEEPPKVVVLRRYPQDWEIFVDIGNGFQLAERAKVNLSNKRGLPMKDILDAVKRFLR